MRRSLIVVFAVAAAPALAGPLTPPAGPVAPSGPTLTQIEPRITIGPDTTPGDADSLFRITEPGSYYLTGNVTGVSGKAGIEIAASNVTIDLGGFTLAGVPGSLKGVLTDGPYWGITVTNGAVTSWGNAGVDIGYFTGNRGNRVEGVHAASNGGTGIRAGGAGIITGCTAVGNGLNGFEASGNTALIVDCTASGNQAGGFNVGQGTRLISCVAYSNVSMGFRLLAATAEGCEAANNQQDGFILQSGAGAYRCAARSNLGDGFEAIDDSVIQDCRAASHASGAGIRVTGGGNRIDGNSIVANGTGIAVAASGNFIVRNTAHSNSTNYSVAGTQTIGPIITTSGNIISTNPWANFGF